MIYDTFTYNGEADILEIRFNVLGKYVDKFVICESQETFSGNWKPLYWAERDERFDEWADKVIYHVVPPKKFDVAFERAAYQKDSIREGLKGCKKDDVVFFGDVDEIWNPFIGMPFNFKWTKWSDRDEIMIGESANKVFNMRQKNYSYFLNNLSSEKWVGTIGGYWGAVKTNSLNYWRANHHHEVGLGGWHFTNMHGYEGILKKLESYDHQECNIPWVRDGLRARMDANIDYLGRTHDWQGKPFSFLKDEWGLPQYILDNKELWRSKGIWK